MISRTKDQFLAHNLKKSHSMLSWLRLCKNKLVLSLMLKTAINFTTYLIKMWNKKKCKFYWNTFIVTISNTYVTLLRHIKDIIILSMNTKKNMGLKIFLVIGLMLFSKTAFGLSRNGNQTAERNLDPFAKSMGRTVNLSTTKYNISLQLVEIYLHRRYRHCLEGLHSKPKHNQK